MTSPSLEQELREYIVSQFGHRLDGRELEPDLNLLGEGVIDSMGVMQLVTFIEEKFQVTVEDDDISPSNFRSIESLTSFVEGKTSG